MASDTGTARPAGQPALAAGGRSARAAAIAGPAAVLLGYVLGAVALTWHLWASPARVAVSGNPWDADLFAWYLRYSATAIAHGHLPALITQRLNAPQGVSLMWNTSILLAGIVLTPVTLLAGPQVGLTVLITAGFAGSAASMLAVLRRWRFGLWPAAVAGAIYGFSPALVQSAVGHYNLQFAVLPPLLVDAGLRLFLAPDGPGRARSATRRESVRAGLRLGVLAAAQLFLAEELLATSAATGALVLAGLAVARPGRLRARLRGWLAERSLPARDLLRRAVIPAAGAAMAAVVTLLLAGVALVTQFAGPLTQHGSPFLVDYYKNDLTVFTDPSSYVLLHSPASALAAAWLPGGAPEQLGYLGWPMIIVLAVVTVLLWRDRRIRALAVVTGLLELLSLGAHPEIHGITAHQVTLPWQWVQGLPLVGLALPDRLSIFADGLIAVIIAILLERAAGRGARSWLAAAVVAGAIGPLIPAPLRAAPVPQVPSGWAATFSALRLRPGARVLLVPIPNSGLTNAMRWQATAGTDISLIGGYFLGPAWNGQAYVDGNGARPTASYLDALWLAGPNGRSAPYAQVTRVARPAPSVVRADVAFWRPAAVVAEAGRGTALGRYLISLFGRPSAVNGSIMAWRLPYGGRR
ncbi:MAG: hypothetical protein ACYCO9_18300 [Streptosporangiaceae bacterium]